ncbi:MAG: three-Cys-motif partner protein TcmP [Alicyclobacillus sp.]|nr:three-Cys-motif partner protein TcmP [Alicyclobacillus sp.]
MHNFFDEMTQQSKVKSEIVTKYFGAWTKVMKNHAKSGRLAYIDLFSGPGKYKDGSKSTPIIILEQCISDEYLRNQIVTIFNDVNPDFVNDLRTTINNLPGIETLKYKPIVTCFDVGEEIIKYFEQTKLVPCLSFIDPWGYKGLSLKLISAMIKDWGSDCIFFFNYNRINAGISNPKVTDHINAIFGQERADMLRIQLRELSPYERELRILNELSESLSANGSNYVLPFRFVRPNGERTSHYLIFVSKHIIGYNIMKDIMWKCSSEHEDGVASFSYVDVDNPQLKLLFDYSRPLDTLGEDLLHQFAGRTLTVKEIYDHHHVGKKFVLSNYKEALRRLEEQGRIITSPPAQQRKVLKGVRTFANDVSVTFPHPGQFTGN